MLRTHYIHDVQRVELVDAEFLSQLVGNIVLDIPQDISSFAHNTRGLGGSAAADLAKHPRKAAVAARRAGIAPAARRCRHEVLAELGRVELIPQLATERNGDCPQRLLNLLHTMIMWESSIKPGFLPAKTTRNASMRLAKEQTIGMPMGKEDFILKDDFSSTSSFVCTFC